MMMMMMMKINTTNTNTDDNIEDNNNTSSGRGGLYRTQQLNPQYRASKGGGAHDSDAGETADLLMIPEENDTRNGPSSDVMSV